MLLKKNTKNLFALFFIFIISRVLLIKFLGVKFEYDWIFQMWHFIDIELLKNKMLESIYYFHYQPPLFNLFLGLIHKQSFISPSVLLQAFFYSLTYLMGVLIFILSQKIGNKNIISFLVTVLFYSFPETIIYENWPIYTWTSSFLLIFSFYCLDSFVVNKKSSYLHLFFSSQLILILTRSAFHPIFFIFWFFYLLIVLKEARLRLTKIFIIYFSFFLIICFKNFYEFGFFGLGSGLGFSLYKISPKVTLTENRKKDLNLDPVFNIVPVRSISTYGFDDKNIPSKFSQIDILNREFKSTLGQFSEEFSVNLGNFHYLDISKRYQKSAIAMIKNFPVEYLKRVLRGMIMFFKPTWDHGFGVSDNAQTLKPLINIITFHQIRLEIESVFVSSEKPWPLKTEIPFSSYLFIPIFYLITLFSIIKLQLFNRRNIQYMFFVYCLVYLISVSNLIELAENDRYRVMIDPLVYLVAVVVFSKLFSSKNVESD